MAEFMRAFASTMRHEGGYSNRKADRGGETYKGISRKFWPDFEGWKLIDRAKEEIGYEPKCGTKEYREWANLLDRVLAADQELRALVVEFYRVNFWRQEYEKIKPAVIADWLFDKHVNTGNYRKVHGWLQAALGVTADGIIGPVTLGAINDHPDPQALLAKARERARAYYRAIVANDPSQAENLNGWLARA